MFKTLKEYFKEKITDDIYTIKVTKDKFNQLIYRKTWLNGDTDEYFLDEDLIFTTEEVKELLKDGYIKIYESDRKPRLGGYPE